jgi:hypothetical protein
MLMTPPITPKTNLKFSADLVALISLYVLLSSFSLYELVQISKMLSNAGMRIKLLIAFVISVALPVYLIFVDNIISNQYIRLVTEITSVVIIVTMYCLSCPASVEFRQICSELFSILMSDVVSSLLLVVLHCLYTKRNH